LFLSDPELMCVAITGVVQRWLELNWMLTNRSDFVSLKVP